MSTSGAPLEAPSTPANHWASVHSIIPAMTPAAAAFFNLFLLNVSLSATPSFRQRDCCFYIIKW